jgi:hypothetical protein
MPDQPPWDIDISNLSTSEIVNLLRELNGSKYSDTIRELRQELVRRARTEGASDEVIIRTLTRGVARGSNLDAVAKEWASTLGLSVKEFKRIANVK